jgi:hypothetical protein
MFQKHDSTVLLEVISAFSVIALLSISFALFDISGTLKESMRQQEEKISVSDLSPELIQQINEQFKGHAQFQDIVRFYFQNLLDQEQINALDRAYVEKQSGIQQPPVAPNATPSSTPPSPSISPSPVTVQ